MSEVITHTAIVDDAMRLMSRWDAICPAFKQAAAEHSRMTQLGSTTRSGDRIIPGALERIREMWPADIVNGSDENKLAPRLAFLLGWMCHRATDRQMKPIFRALCPNWPETPTECSIYHDAFLYRERYATADNSPFCDETFGLGQAAGRYAASLDILRALAQRTLVELHTFAPDEAHPWEWLENLFDAQQAWVVNAERYARAIAQPDPALVQRYVDDARFYHADEPIIALAVAVESGEDVTSENVDDALAAEPTSHYGIALHRSMRYLRSASAFFVSEMTVAELESLLDVGVLGRDGIVV